MPITHRPNFAVVIDDTYMTNTRPLPEARRSSVRVYNGNTGDNITLSADARIYGAVIRDNVSITNLQRTRFDYCDLRNMNFSGCDLTDAAFIGCQLSNARFDGAILSGTQFPDCRADMTTVWDTLNGVPTHRWQNVLTQTQVNQMSAYWRRDWNDVCGNCEADNNDCECNSGEDERDDEGDIDSYTNLYSYNVDVIRKCGWPEQNERNALVFGVELEMEAATRSGRYGEEDMQSKLVDALGGPQASKFICKSDGSLTYGVELVTLPYTLDQHRTEFGWAALLKRVHGKAKSGAGTENCGMHVHINKAALSPLLIGKMLVFANSSTVAALVSAIAQRSSNGYCSRDTKKVTDGKRRSNNRYDILNVGPKTVECRMFRGNLRADRVVKNIEFCHAMVLYCRDCSLQEIESWKNFSRWLITHRGEYPNLVKFLIEKRVPGFGQLASPKDQTTESEV